jgi:four helix bundle protein
MNLIEGAMRLGSREYRQFVEIARGSAGEVCYQLLLARDSKYISNETYLELRSGYDRVIQMLLRLSQSLNQKSKVRSRDS